MRTYTRNSPEAAARIVALVLIADGYVSNAEDKALDRLDVAHELGLREGDFQRVVQRLCEDLSVGGAPAIQLLAHVDERILSPLLNCSFEKKPSLAKIYT
jgi:hypothetical protein